jgi:prophage regulatory protein
MISDYLSDKQLAARWAVNKATPWRWSREGLLAKPIKLSSGCTRWRAADIQQFEAKRSEQTA